ncbi:MAG TPA: hypothetical protein VG819_04430 [Rhizomicrobium sp.]|nr:hypothetical protein [Rhizomicrobium sp.]
MIRVSAAPGTTVRRLSARPGRTRRCSEADRLHHESREEVMGLTMYAITFTTAVAADVDFDPGEVDLSVLHFWDDHLELHCWMERLYHRKGGRMACFDDATVILTAEDLGCLERDLCSERRADAHSGPSDKHAPTSAKDDLLFIANAREAIAKGLFVAYSAWW